MVYGYVRHSQNNEEFINKQIEKLNGADKIVIEDNGNTQLHNLISHIAKEDSIVVVSIDRLKNMSLEDAQYLKTEKISITSLDGYVSDYENQTDEQKGVLFKNTHPLAGIF